MIRYSLFEQGLEMIKPHFLGRRRGTPHAINEKQKKQQPGGPSETKPKKRERETRIMHSQKKKKKTGERIDGMNEP